MARTSPLVFALALALPLAAATPSPAPSPAAAGPRPALAIVTVDYNKIMAGSRYAQKLQARLQALDESIRRQVEPMVEAFRKRKAAFQSGAASMTPDQRSKEEAEIGAMEQQLNVVQQQAQQAYNQQRDALAKQMREFLIPILAALAKERSWDMVLARNGSEVVWAGDATDASDLLVERLNAAPMPEEPAASMTPPPGAGDPPQKAPEPKVKPAP